MIAKIKRWRFRTFVAPKKRALALLLLAKLMPELQVLKRKLESLNQRLVAPVVPGNAADKIPLIVELFALIAPWSDRGIRDLLTAFGQSGSVPASAEYLSQHFRNAGRSQCGYNRTKPGEAVTVDNVWLGDRCGLWTKKVSYWLSRREDTSHVCYANNGQSMTVCDVIWWQAGEFMDDHIEPMIKFIKDLENLAVTTKRAA